MKRIMLRLPIMMVAVTMMMLSACKKDSSTTLDDLDSAKEQNAVNNAMNSTTDDVVNAAGQVNSFSGKTDGGNLHFQALCGGVVSDTGTAATRTITITYDGLTVCQGVTKTGTVTARLTTGNSWRDYGAVITVTTSGLQVTDVATGGSFTINGTRTITNETTNNQLAYDVFVNNASGPVIHRHQGNLDITFADQSHRTWTIDRTRTYTRLASGKINIAISGEGSGNVIASGVNRRGDNFTTTISTPIQATNNASCLWKPYTGLITHTVGGRSVSIQYGTDINGTPDGTSETCASGYYVTYTKGNRTYSKFVEYWH